MEIILKKIYIDKEELHLLIDSTGSVLKEFIVSNDILIRDVKRKIEKQAGFIVDGQALNYQGEILEDEKALSDYMITNHSIINIIARLRGGMRIFVKAPNENIFAFTAESDDKIYHLKSKIEKLLGIKMGNQILSNENEILEDEKTLEQYGIVDKSLINIELGMQMYLRRVGGTTELVTVGKADKIRDVKLRIQNQIGLAPDEQKLVYQGGILEDERTAEDYGIADGSVINVVSRLRRYMQIFPKTGDGKIVPIEVLKTDTIRDVKLRIQNQIGLAPDEPKLVYQGGILEDERTAVHYGIADESMIDVVAIGGMLILAKTMDGKIVPIEVQKTDTIRDVKLKIQEKVGVAPDEQILVYEGGILEDERTVEEYQIAEKSVINVVARSRGGMQIFAKTMDGKTVAFEVQKTDTIRDIKLKIQEKIGLAPDEQKLVYEGGILEDERTVEDYGIAEKSVINVPARLRGGMQIFAKTMDGKTVAIEVQKTEKIRDVKLKIQEKIGLAPDEQKLIYQGGILEDERTVEEYQIAEKSVINVVARSRSPLIWLQMKLVGKNIHGLNMMTLDAQAEDKITHIKKKFKEITGIASVIYQLRCRDQILKDGRSVGDYRLRNGDILTADFSPSGIDKYFVNFINHFRGGAGNDIIKRQLFILQSNREHILMHFDVAADINWIRGRIEEKIGLAAARQEWLYQGDIYYADADAEMPEEMRCDAGPVFIVCERKEFQCKVDESNIANIKQKIQQEMQLDNGTQKLVIHSKQWRGGQLAYRYSVLERSVFMKYSNIKKLCLLIKAIKIGSLNNVKEYFKSYKSEIKHGSYSRSPLLYACKFGHRDIVEYFIDKKCKLDSSDCELRSGLHYAVISKNKAIIELLIDKGADINAPDSILVMPLHLACKANNIEAVRLLMENNCFVNALDRLFRLPLQIAEADGFKDVVNLIKEYQMIRKVASAMELKCGQDCIHKFCYKSLYRKKFQKGKIVDIGGYGEIYPCTESLTGRVFAVKRILKTPDQAKYIELNINDFLDLLSHERIVKYFGAILKNEKHFIFMEYLKDGSLAKKLQMLSSDKVILYTKQILEALEFLREGNIVHRDIKPQNILLDVNGNLKLSDFGWSLLLSSLTDVVPKTGTFCGTSFYIAPEILNYEPYTFSIDIWSLGVTVIELCTGKPPYQDLGPGRAMTEVLTTRKIVYKLPENMPTYIKDLIDLMLEPDQSKRATPVFLLNTIKNLHF